MPTEGGYARELTPEQQIAQQAELQARIPGFDAVITTAAIPGRPAPKLITAEAVRAMRPGWFPLGPRGAGRSATAGHGEGAELAGQGGAYRERGPTKLLAFVVVNAYGVIVDRAGRTVRGKPSGPVPGRVARGPAQNTTLSLVVTNQRLDQLQLRSIGRQVHASMARGIQPFHARWDGDVSYMVTTQDVANADLDEVTLGEIASDAMWDAILASYGT